MLGIRHFVDADGSLWLSSSVCARLVPLTDFKPSSTTFSLDMARAANTKERQYNSNIIREKICAVQTKVLTKGVISEQGLSHATLSVKGTSPFSLLSLCDFLLSTVFSSIMWHQTSFVGLHSPSDRRALFPVDSLLLFFFSHPLPGNRTCLNRCVSLWWEGKKWSPQSSYLMDFLTLGFQFGWW